MENQENIHLYLMKNGWLYQDKWNNVDCLLKTLEQDIRIELTKHGIEENKHKNYFSLDCQAFELMINGKKINLLQEKDAESLQYAIKTAIESIVNAFTFKDKFYRFKNQSEYDLMMDAHDVLTSLEAIKVVYTKHIDNEIEIHLKGICASIQKNGKSISCVFKDDNKNLSQNAKRFFQALCLTFYFNNKYSV